MTDTQDLLESSFELNLNNYGPEDVERLNDWAIEAYKALEAAQAAQVPEGWKLVPVEPTVGMLLAYDPSHSRAGFEWGAKQWRRMLSAAPSHSRMDRILDRQRNDRDKAMSVLSAAINAKGAK